jgi:hypothetical protein
MGCKTLHFFSPVRRPASRELAESLNRATSLGPSIVSLIILPSSSSHRRPPPPSATPRHVAVTGSHEVRTSVLQSKQHSLCLPNQWSTHPVWNWWPHGRTRTSSPSPHSLWQSARTQSSCEISSTFPASDCSSKSYSDCCHACENRTSPSCCASPF